MSKPKYTAEFKIGVAKLYLSGEGSYTEYGTLPISLSCTPSLKINGFKNTKQSLLHKETHRYQFG